jgi:rhomboid protease GluP
MNPTDELDTLEEPPAEPPEPPADAPAAPAAAPAKRKKKRAAKPAKAPGPEPFALYLARLYVTEKGYRLGTVPEAAAIAEAADVVLTYADGMSFAILAIVDAERDPERHFGLAAAELIEIGKACLHFTGRVNNAQLPVVIQIVEVRGELTEADKRRLTAIHARRLLDKVHVRGFVLAPPTGEVWSTLTFGWFAERGFRRMLTAPRRTEAELTAPAPAFATMSGPPWLTIGLLGVIAALFVVELVVGAAPGAEFLTPPLRALVALGGASGALVLGQGEWWRLFTATLLHGGPLHLVLNGVGLFFGGVVLEELFGRAWLGALFVLGALGGSLASVLINDPGTVSVGASGAIMGLLAAAMVASYRLPPRQRPQIQMPLLQMLVPSLIPIAVQRTGGHIDFAAHFGGALTGALAGLALLRTWPVAEPHPRFRRAAALVAIAGAAAYLISFAQVYAGLGAFDR